MSKKSAAKTKKPGKRDSSAAVIAGMLVLILIFAYFAFSFGKRYVSASCTPLDTVSDAADKGSADVRWTKKRFPQLIFYIDGHEYFLRNENIDAGENIYALADEIDGGAELDVAFVEVRYGLFYDFRQYAVLSLKVNGREVTIPDADTVISNTLQTYKTNFIVLTVICGAFTFLLVILIIVSKPEKRGK